MPVILGDLYPAWEQLPRQAAYLTALVKNPLLRLCDRRRKIPPMHGEPKRLGTLQPLLETRFREIAHTHTPFIGSIVPLGSDTLPHPNTVRRVLYTC